MSQALAQRLQKAIQKIQKQHPDAILQLNEGASEADFSALEAAVWLQLPDDIKEVYRVQWSKRRQCVFVCGARVVELGAHRRGMVGVERLVRQR